MEKVFEDRFVEWQSELIFLCMDLVESKVDKIYAYCSNEKKCKMFNAFFEVNGEVKTFNQLGLNMQDIFQVLQEGTSSLDELDQIGTEYGMPIPTEMKMYYDLKTRKYSAECKYEELSPDKDAQDVFMNWISEVKQAKQ